MRWPTGAAVPTAGSWFTVVGRVDGFATADFTVVLLVSAQAVRAERAPKEQYEF